VSLKRRINVALSRATGYELHKRKLPPTATQARKRRRALRPGDRLLEAPTFVLCSVRSGSTLLRVLLDSHPLICAPHELHLRDMAVALKTDYAAKSLGEVGLDPTRLEYLLWDRVLHRELAESGKELLVNKTPNDVFIADAIKACWPDARFIFLLRHPQAIADSRHRARPQDPAERNIAKVLKYGAALEAARSAHDGLTVRYEDLATDPAAETRRICTFLGVEWEAEMLDYGRYDHGAFRPGLGDWSDNIRSGRVQPPGPPPRPEDVVPELRALAAAWGYPAAVRA
jgi:hypothetical protein